MKILITGGAGFIGSHTVKALVARGDEVVIVDDLNDYYDPKLNQDRLDVFLKDVDFEFNKLDISDMGALKEVFSKHKFNCIVHLAAQAGVRYSLENPFAYEKSNNLGTLNILELARHNNVKNVVMASSSSVYGNNQPPFKESDSVDTPISLYASTKKYNELMAHTYHHLFGLNCTCLRFFTVYGPWGRPDMALFLFTKAILEDNTIDVFNKGKMKRNFTYVSDIVAGILSSVDHHYPYEVFNLGGEETVKLTYFIECIEKELNKEAKQNFLPLQPGDVLDTIADISKAREMLDFQPKVNVEDGIKNFVEWYNSYFS